MHEPSIHTPPYLCKGEKIILSRSLGGRTSSCRTQCCAIYLYQIHFECESAATNRLRITEAGHEVCFQTILCCNVHCHWNRPEQTGISVGLFLKWWRHFRERGAMLCSPFGMLQTDSSNPHQKGIFHKSPHSKSSKMVCRRRLQHFRCQQMFLKM